MHEQSLSPKKTTRNDDIYAEFDKYDEKPKKHASPTRRLVQQKDAAVEQKGYLSKQAEFKADKSRYGLTYVVGVENTYVV